MNLGEKIKALREERGISQNKLAKMAGISQSGLSSIESTTKSPNTQTIMQIAEALGVSMLELIENDAQSSMPDNVIPMPKMRKIPLLGTIACGEPILAVENLDGEVSIPDDIRADFALRCKGDSMINARIFDGDVVYIRQQPNVENGQIAAVLIGDEATLKYVRRYEDRLILEPANPTYKPLVYWKDEMNQVRILGRAVGFVSVKI